ncbi:hypothetical protein [Desulfoluna sp.]|uniref:hypothetical protein n=1 Tax=Desulfoluna sp. TaxID=2045199 RepID=UPI0026110DDC|nr:hypothetical protein [Desulfoluna sp.]
MNKRCLLIIFLMVCFLFPINAGATPKISSGETVQKESGIIFHGNKRSFKFHAPDCRYYHCKNCTIILHSTTEAKEKNFSPCSLCKPLYYAQRHAEKKINHSDKSTAPLPASMPSSAGLRAKPSSLPGSVTCKELHYRCVRLQEKYKSTKAMPAAR